jgi:hypothetical protein
LHATALKTKASTGIGRQPGARIVQPLVAMIDIETGLADRAIAGQAPPMKAAATVDELVALVVDGIRTGRRELRYDLQKGEFAGR